MIGHVIFDALRRTSSGDVAARLFPYEDYGLLLVSYDAPPPEPKIYRVELDGRSGTLDMTEWLGDVMYNDRTVTVTLRDLIGRMDDFLNRVLGRRVRVWFDVDEPGVYYEGRVEHATKKTRSHVTDTALTIVCHPFKHHSGEPGEAASGMAPTGISTVTITAQNNATETATIALWQDVSYPTIEISGYSAGGSVTVNGTAYTITADGLMSAEPALLKGNNTVALSATNNGAALTATLIYENRLV